jgi:glycosyltransferase involved in cell wall biosynthesis
MKIALVANNLKANDGWSRYSYDLASALIAAGHDVLVLVAEKTEAPINQVVVLGASDQFLISPKVFWLNCWRQHGLIAKVLAEFRPDAIYVTVEPYLFFLLVALPKRRQPKIFISLHGTFAVPQLLFSGWQRRAVYFLWGWALKRVNNICIGSRFTFEYFKKYYPSLVAKVKMINYGLDLSGLAAPAAVPVNSPKKIIFVGGIKIRKGLLEAVQALKIYLARYGSNFVYEIIGSYDEADPYYLKVLKFIRDNNLENNVIFRGRVSEQEKIVAYQTADLFLMLSVPDGARFEGFGLVHLEANAFGLPAVGSKNCGSEDAISDGVSGFLVDPRRSEEVAEKIDLVLNRGAISRQVCRQWAESNDIKFMADKIINLYQQ